MQLRYHQYMWILFCLTLGCAPITKSKRSYETVVGTPNRDEAKAIALVVEAQKHLEKGHFEKAEQALRDALLADVTYGPAHNNLGKVYYQQQKRHLAAWEFEYAINTMPDFPEPHNNLGLVYEDVGKLPDAIAYYTTAHELDPEEPEYIGNLARARFKLDEDDPDIKELLEDLLRYDTRPFWVNWAREMLGLQRARDVGNEIEQAITAEQQAESPGTESGPGMKPAVNQDDVERLPAPLPPLINRGDAARDHNDVSFTLDG